MCVISVGYLNYDPASTILNSFLIDNCNKLLEGVSKYQIDDP